MSNELRCKNCNQHLILNQKFCHECGQEANTHRINFHFLIHEVQHGIFHIDGGILFTLKELFVRPGNSMREFLDGKRKNHFKPVLLIVILGAIYSFLNHYFESGKSIVGNTNIKSTAKIDKDLGFNVNKFVEFLHNIGDWVNSHWAFSVLLMLPFISFGFYLAFRKYRLNFPEWLVISTFITGQILAIDIFFLVFEKFAFQTSAFSTIVIFGFMIWTMIQLFKTKPKLNVVLRTILGLFLGFLFILIVIILMVLIVYLLTKN